METLGNGTQEDMPLDNVTKKAYEHQQELAKILYSMIGEKYRWMIDPLTINSYVDAMLTDINSGNRTLEEVQRHWL